MKSIDVISVPVSDPERSKRFYAALGFEIMAETKMTELQTWIQMGLQGSQASITLVTWFKKMPAGCMQGLVIGTDSIESDLADLKSKGLDAGEIEETPWGKFALLKDPDGNGLSLHQRVV